MVSKKGQMKLAKKSKKITKKNITKRTPKQIKYASIQARKTRAKKALLKKESKKPKNMIRLLTKNIIVKDGKVKSSGMLLHVDNKKTVMVKQVDGKKTKKVLCGKPSIKRIQQQFITL